ncbi:MAG: UDP-N-acetylglucosamine 2-epimerase (non-hydrolyzing) [Flavobacteriaceae bacterium]|nr:UDP-N-acetylglucosamine 2-epimerase (non-hydrolyzing) [Flavobacteriaceae bacterium]
MKKVVTILGARPQFVKAAVLSRIIAKKNEFEEVIVHTGQHFDANMSDVFFDEMEIPKPKYNLNINSLSHGVMTGQMIEKIEEVLLIEKPNAIIIFGDTNSTIAGAIAAKKLNIKIVHIEAGLRSYNMQMPEEINRILTDRISDLLLCPTDTAIENLQKEGFDDFGARVVKTGYIMKDAVEFYSKFSEEKSKIIDRLELQTKPFILATIHRQENTDNIEKLKSIFESLESISNETQVVLPLHPRTRKILAENNLDYNLKIIDPVGYFDMLELLKNCKMVITDSGGLQKEAFFNKKYCIIIRDETEWVELVKNGFAEIVGSDKQRILKSFQKHKEDTLSFSINLYGNQVGLSIYKELKALVLN